VTAGLAKHLGLLAGAEPPIVAEFTGRLDGAGLAVRARYVGSGENVWSTVHIEDVADAYLLALEGARPGSFFFIENGETSFKSIVASIARLLGGKRAAEGWSIDEAIAEWGPMAVWFSLGGNSRVNADKARGMLGWRPHGASLEHEIEKGWYRRQLEAGAYAARKV